MHRISTRFTGLQTPTQITLLIKKKIHLPQKETNIEPQNRGESSSIFHRTCYIVTVTFFLPQAYNQRKSTSLESSQGFFSPVKVVRWKRRKFFSSPFEFKSFPDISAMWAKFQYAKLYWTEKNCGTGFVSRLSLTGPCNRSVMDFA